MPRLPVIFHALALVVGVILLAESLYFFLRSARIEERWRQSGGTRTQLRPWIVGVALFVAGVAAIGTNLPFFV